MAAKGLLCVWVAGLSILDLLLCADLRAAGDFAPESLLVFFVLNLLMTGVGMSGLRISGGRCVMIWMQVPFVCTHKHVVLLAVIVMRFLGQDAFDSPFYKCILELKSNLGPHVSLLRQPVVFIFKNKRYNFYQ